MEPIKKSEWTLGKILLRLLLYPFCAVVLYVAIAHFLKEGNYKLGIAGIVIPLLYLVPDLVLILKDFQRKKNTDIT